MDFNVLVVDNSAAARAMAIQTLADTQLPIAVFYQATNGHDALVVLRVKCVDLVVVNINMPEMSGIELIAAMREDEYLRTTPVIVVSNMRPGLRADSLPLGIAAFVRKPFTPEQLGTVAVEVLRPECV